MLLFTGKIQLLDLYFLYYNIKNKTMQVFYAKIAIMCANLSNFGKSSGKTELIILFSCKVAIVFDCVYKNELISNTIWARR